MAFDPVSAALDIGGKLIDRLWPDPAQAAQAKVALLDMQQKGELAAMTADTASDTAQAAINQVEAGSSAKFISYWRPALGWACVAGFTYECVLGPLATLGAALCGYTIVMPPAPPELNWTLSGMLGLTHVSRSVEKYLGINTK